MNASAGTGSAVASLLVLVGVLALIPACLWLVRRFSGFDDGRRGGLALLASLGLGPRERIVVVRVAGDRHLVVGVTAASMTVLAELDGPPEAGAPPLPAGAAFAQVLAARMRGAGRPAAPAPSPAAPSAATASPTTASPASAPPGAPAGPGGTVRSHAWLLVPLLLALVLFLMPDGAYAQTAGLLSIQQSSGAQGTTWSVPLQTLLAFTALSFLPAVLLMMTSFTRIVIVLSLVRQAIGLQTAPPTQVVIGLALFLSAFVMGPTLERVYGEAYAPYSEQRIDFAQALERGAQPLREFMLKQTRATDLATFARLAGMPASGPGMLEPRAAPMRLLVPAFAISELKTAFQIGFMVFVPFILIDLVCASVLMSLGMMMVSPVMIALPFKMVLFVLADGWSLLVGSLVASFAP